MSNAAKIKDLKKRLKVARKELKYLESAKAEKDHIQTATELLDTLAERWAGLTAYIEKAIKSTRKKNYLIGPHGRPRHLWGYLYPDEYVGYAMDRRVFNSVSQGLASDIGYVSIYLTYKFLFQLRQRGFVCDIVQYNAVHDSAFADLAFEFLPIYTYMQEHCMITLTNRYYEKYFNMVPECQYGFDLEMGLNEADLREWNKRPHDLPAYCEQMGEVTDASKKSIRKTVEDGERIGQLRLRELKENRGECFLLDKPKEADLFLGSLNVFQ